MDDAVDNDNSGVVIIDDNFDRDDDDDDMKNKIAIIMGQTEYSAEEALKLLIATNGDEIAVIRMYLGLPPPPHTDTDAAVTAPKSKNQLIYQEIRKFMDGCKENVDKQ